MALVHYTATVKADRLLELPDDARVLHLMPGQEIEIQFDHSAVVQANEALASFNEFLDSQKERDYTDGSDTLRLIREARAGAMYGTDYAAALGKSSSDLISELPPRRIGWAADRGIWMSDDFDEPLEVFREYM